MRIDLSGKSIDLIKLPEPPSPGDIVYHDSTGWVKFKVRSDYSGNHRKFYPELVLLEVIEDFGPGTPEEKWFQPGQTSLRQLDELWQEDPLMMMKRKFGGDPGSFLMIGVAAAMNFDIVRALSKGVVIESRPKIEIPTIDRDNFYIKEARNRREKRNLKRPQRRRG